MDVNNVVWRSIIESKAKAVAMFAERRGIDPDDVVAIMGEYNPETHIIEWLCWQRGTLVYQDADGNEHRR